MNKNNIIWDNNDIVVDAEFYSEEYGYILEDMTEQEKEDWMQERAVEDVYIALDDERTNLNITTEGRILCIADLGLWNGRRQGYKILNNNVNACLSVLEDYNSVYTDGKDVRCDAIHHDGTNHYLFREIREDRDIDSLIDSIYRGEEISRQKLSYYTKSIRPYVQEVYGFK